MAPLARVSIGYLLVILDLRIDGLDIIPDLLGWALALTGLVALAGRQRWFVLATVGAGVGILAALPALTGEPGGAWQVLTGLAEGALVFGTCSGIRALVHDEGVRRSADWIRWSDLGLTSVATIPLLAAPDSTLEVTGEADALVVVLVLVALSLAVWFLVFCWRNRDRAEVAREPVGAEVA